MGPPHPAESPHPARPGRAAPQGERSLHCLSETGQADTLLDTRLNGLGTSRLDTKWFLRNWQARDMGSGRQAHTGQDALDKRIALLEAHQKEVHDALVSMEGHALSLYQASPHPPPALTNAIPS